MAKFHAPSMILWGTILLSLSFIQTANATRTLDETLGRIRKLDDEISDISANLPVLQELNSHHSPSDMAKLRDDVMREELRLKLLSLEDPPGLGSPLKPQGEFESRMEYEARLRESHKASLGEEENVSRAIRAFVALQMEALKQRLEELHSQKSQLMKSEVILPLERFALSVEQYNLDGAYFPVRALRDEGEHGPRFLKYAGRIKIDKDKAALFRATEEFHTMTLLGHFVGTPPALLIPSRLLIARHDRNARGEIVDVELRPVNQSIDANVWKWEDWSGRFEGCDQRLHHVSVVKECSCGGILMQKAACTKRALLDDGPFAECQRNQFCALDVRPTCVLSGEHQIESWGKVVVDGTQLRVELTCN